MDQKKSLSQASPISKRTEPAFLKPCPKVTKVSSIAIEFKSSRGTFSSIAIELKVDGQRALIHITQLLLLVVVYFDKKKIHRT